MYLSSLPPHAHVHLDQPLDYDNKGVVDLIKIADHMIKWEEKLAAGLQLTDTDIYVIKKDYHDQPVLQR